MVLLRQEYVFGSRSVLGAEQAGQKSTSHILGVILERSGAVSPYFSWGFHCF